MASVQSPLRIIRACTVERHARTVSRNFNIAIALSPGHSQIYLAAVEKNWEKACYCSMVYYLMQVTSL